MAIFVKKSAHLSDFFVSALTPLVIFCCPPLPPSNISTLHSLACSLVRTHGWLTDLTRVSPLNELQKMIKCDCSVVQQIHSL